MAAAQVGQQWRRAAADLGLPAVNSAQLVWSELLSIRGSKQDQHALMLWWLTVRMPPHAALNDQFLAGHIGADHAWS